MGSRGWAALAATGFYGVHALVLWERGFPVHAVWMCHLSNLAIAVGWGLGRGAPIAVGVLWLVLGTPLWVANIFVGAEGTFVWSSALTHLGGLGLGVAGVRRFGWPRGAWIWAAGALGVLHLVSRFIGGAVRDNVNFAGYVLPGWEGTFGTHARFVGFSAVVVLVVFAAIEWAALRRRSDGRSDG